MKLFQKSSHLMRTMRFSTIGIAAAAALYRKFSSSTRSSAKSPNWVYGKLKKRDRAKDNGRQRRPKIEWTNEQKSIFSAVSQGSSVFITGSAGTGKTLVLKEIIRLLKKVYKPSQVSVVASTGIAACALKGQTLHSFAGISFRTDDPQDLLDGVLNSQKACKRWRKVKALVIDEISMVDAKLFDNLEYIAREVRGVDEIWGGIQRVVSGDFFQLPPIPKKNSLEVKFAFEAACWNVTFDLHVELKKIFRQSDLQLIKLLQGIRTGEIDPLMLEFLLQSCSKTECDPSVVQLFPMNKDVEKVNEERLKSLQKEVFVYRAVDNGEHPWKGQLSQGIAPDEISICEGARVMLIKNLDVWRGLINGATGTVLGFSKAVDDDGICPDKLLPIVEFDSGNTMIIEPEMWDIMDGDKVVAWRKQIPLILAWALSIHKCQGMTLDRVHTNLEKAFGCGMVYVALSRVRSLQGLHLSGFAHSKIKADPKVIKFYESFASEHNKEDLDVSCNKRKDSTSSVIGLPDKVSTAET